MLMKHLILLMLLCITKVAAQVVPADGLWRTSDDPDVGSGLAIFTQGTQTLVSVFTYAESGDSRWYTAAGQVDADGVFEARLLETRQGSYITAENPVSAEFIGTERRIKMTFDGSQTGTLSIDGSAPKAMQAFHFGIQNWRTENQQLADDSGYLFADLAGRWVFADSETQRTLLLYLEATVSQQVPETIKTYVSNHYSTEGWEFACPLLIPEGGSQQRFCTLTPQDEAVEALQVNFTELGNQRMKLQAVGTPTRFQGFKMSLNNKLLPSDGLWRTTDDPAVGSGLVMRTQEDATVILLYSYDDAGQASWEILSGHFDEAGRLETNLLRTTNGSPINADAPGAATYTAQRKAIRIELQGTELATMYIEGSEPKKIQHYKYGVELHDTEHVQLDGSNYRFPDLTGNWVYYGGAEEYSRAYTININSGNLFPSSPPIENARRFSGRFQRLEYRDPYGMEVTCLQDVIDGLVVPFCESEWWDNDFVDSTRVYFEDMGYRKFNMFYSSELPPEAQRTFVQQFIRLD